MDGLDKIWSELIEEKSLYNLVSGDELAVLIDESTDEAGRVQLARIFTELTQLLTILKKGMFPLGNLVQVKSLNP